MLDKNRNIGQGKNGNNEEEIRMEVKGGRKDDCRGGN